MAKLINAFIFGIRRVPRSKSFWNSKAPQQNSSAKKRKLCCLNHWIFSELLANGLIVRVEISVRIWQKGSVIGSLNSGPQRFRPMKEKHLTNGILCMGFWKIRVAQVQWRVSLHQEPKKIHKAHPRQKLPVLRLKTNQESKKKRCSVRSCRNLVSLLPFCTNRGCRRLQTGQPHSVCVKVGLRENPSQSIASKSFNRKKMWRSFNNHAMHFLLSWKQGTFSVEVEDEHFWGR